MVKLINEDDHAIRNTLLGYRVLKKPDQIRRHLGLASNTAIMAYLANTTLPTNWLDSANCSVLLEDGAARESGNMKIAEMPTVLELIMAGSIVNGHRLVRKFVVERNHSEYAWFSGSEEHCELNESSSEIIDEQIACFNRHLGTEIGRRDDV